MGRHATPAEPSRKVALPRFAPGAVAVVVLVLVAVGLGIWWWTLRSSTDPIDANPVNGTATVVSSQACPASGGTVVEIDGLTPPVQATMDACGYTAGRQVAVEYLAGDPAKVRLAGTSEGGASGASRWLPLAILVAGVLAVGGLVLLLFDRRRSRHGRRRVETAAPPTAPQPAPQATAAQPTDGTEAPPVPDHADTRPAAAVAEVTPVAGSDDAPGVEPPAADDYWRRPETDDSIPDDRDALQDTDTLHLRRSDMPVVDEPPAAAHLGDDLFTHHGSEPGRG
jgi:hypothetical protein